MSPALEGKSSHSLTAMARELVTEKGIGEQVAAVWCSLDKERQDPPADLGAAQTSYENCREILRVE